MYVACGEKRKGLIFTRWSPREMYYDIDARILYYSAKGTSSASVRYQDPNGQPGQTASGEQWKALRVMQAKPLADEHNLVKTSYTDTNSEMLAICFRGLPLQEVPPQSEWMKPPLSDSVALQRSYDELREDHEPFLRDPFCQKELFELVRDCRRVMQRERELRRARERLMRSDEHQGSSEGSRSRSQTPIPSLGQTPPADGIPNVMMLSSLCFRFSCHYELWRFFLVVSFTLGYDALQASPYNGFPPYDPRNSVSYAPPPPQLWQCLRGVVAAHHPYIFLHSSLLGKSDSGSFCSVAERGFLCLSHDAMFYVGEDGKTLQWVDLLSVESMLYNSLSQTPYAIVRTDYGKPDVIVEVTPDLRCRLLPPEVKDYRSNSSWLSAFQLRRFANALLMSFSSTETRRYIRIKEIDVPTVQQGVLIVPASPVSPSFRGTSRLYPTASTFSALPQEEESLDVDLTLAIRRKNYEPFPMRKTALKKAWRIASDARSDLNAEVAANAAVPLYDDGAVNAPLSPRQVELARQLCEEEEEEKEKVVGVTIETLRSIDAQAADGEVNFSSATVVRMVSPIFGDEDGDGNDRYYSINGEYLQVDENNTTAVFVESPHALPT